MSEILFTLPFHLDIDWWIIHLHWHHMFGVTAWKLIGWTGALMFGGRWAVQALVSHLARKPVLPIIFWYMSFIGSACALAYFIWGKNDSVGIIMNAFPCGFTLYNIYLHFSHQKKQGAEGDSR